MKLPDAFKLITSGDQVAYFFIAGGYFYLRFPLGQTPLTFRQKYDKKTAEWVDYDVDKLATLQQRAVARELYRLKIRSPDIASFLKLKQNAVNGHISAMIV
jgi:hypothetical protein